jgi:hypothetical protein
LQSQRDDGSWDGSSSSDEDKVGSGVDRAEERSDVWYRDKRERVFGSWSDEVEAYENGELYGDDEEMIDV